MIEESNDTQHDESNSNPVWSPPTWQRTTPEEVAKDIWCPGCAIPATAGLPKTTLHICDKRGGR
jgi:hypothetical protein